MILVTGASGLLGANLAMVAREQGREVVGLYHRHRVHLPGVELRAADLTEESEIARVFTELGPTTVIHCAAETNVDWCEEHPEDAHRINVTIPARIAEVAFRTGTRLVHISTDSVFDGVRGDYAESDQPAPVNVYAQTKLQSELEVLRHNPKAAIARVNLYGWNAQNKRSLGEWILSELASGKEVRGFTDTVFCPILANDLAEILLAIVDHQLTGLYHVVGSEAVSKYEFARRVALTFGLNASQVVPARMTDAGLKAPRPRNMSLRTEKISSALARAMPDVDSGLRRFVERQSDGYVERLKSHLAGTRE